MSLCQPWGAAAGPAAAQEPDRIFDKSTVWRPLTPNDKLVVYGVDDPEVAGFDLVRQDAPDGSALWIHDDDHGDVEAVIRFVLRLAEEAPADMTLRRFTDELLARGRDQHEPSLRTVTLATLHAAKGLEWDATLVVDPDAIVQESPGGARVLYVVLTRAAHRMSVLRPTD